MYLAQLEPVGWKEITAIPAPEVAEAKHVHYCLSSHDCCSMTLCNSVYLRGFTRAVDSIHTEPKTRICYLFLKYNEGGKGGLIERLGQ